MTTLRLALVACVCVLVESAWAQSYPSKPIRWVVPSSPGGSADAVTRVVADGVSKVLAQRVVVENRAGANGNIGSELERGREPIRSVRRFPEVRSGQHREARDEAQSYR